MSVKLKSALTAIALCTIAGVANAQTTVPASEVSEVTDALIDVIRTDYVFEAKGADIIQGFSEILESGSYITPKTYEAFADKLTDDLVSISGDKHFKVNYNPDFIASRWSEEETLEPSSNEDAAKDGEADFDWNLWYAQRANYGFQRVEILDGNVGFIKLNFFHHIDWSRDTIDSAMKFVSDTEALIIDLRTNGGGYSPSDIYIASHFFEDGGSVWDTSYERRTDETEVSYVFDEVNGDKYLGKPIYVLTSDQTFSLAESLAYGLKHFGKATIVGEASAGAAHSIDIARLSDNFFVQVPISHGIHPVTQKDWEGVGVIPMIETSAEEAQDAAHRDALRRLMDAEDRDGVRKMYKVAIDRLDTKLEATE